MNIASENTPLWYVVHTYSGYENKVATNLKKMVENRNISDLILDISIPTETVSEVTPDGERSSESDKVSTKEVIRKLYPCYVFVKMVMNPETWHIVRNTTGVTGFVGPGSAPTPLSPEEVKAMGVEVRVIELKYDVGDSVKICSGPLTDKEGVVEKISADKTKVTVIVQLFGRATNVDLDTDQVEIIE